MTRILIADDHDVVRRGLRALLGSHQGWKVVADVADGYEAIDAAIRTSPDVVVIDCAMRRMNGLEATRRIRHQNPKTEVCIFTDCTEEAVIGNALSVGARGFVLKSDAEREILAAVEALSNHHPIFPGSCRRRCSTTMSRKAEIRRPPEC